MLPIGFIALWNGPIATIPPGWALCDGNNGTPDLRDRFVVGAGDTYDPDDSGGSDVHLHGFTTDGHFHSIAGGVAIGAGIGAQNVTTFDFDQGFTSSNSNLPPYYALAYIMRV